MQAVPTSSVFLNQGKKMKIEMQGICKSFGNNRVLENVEFSVSGGEICALLGENGAGKSTLMNILGGIIHADSGNLLLDGTEVNFLSPVDSLNSGIAFIHQELNLINDLTIYENMFIGRELKKHSGFLNSRKMIEKTQETFERMNVQLNPCEMVKNLDASYKQIVEISRAMLMNASIIIMDEPTTSLTEPEIERVFTLMRQLKKQNVAIIFISHKLGEVLEICTKYTILRDGCIVTSGPTEGITTAQLAFYMVGHQISSKISQKKMVKGPEILRVENYSDHKHFDDISLSVHRSEVLGITGLLGDGRSELFLSIFGAGSPSEGKIFLDGKETQINSTSDAVKKRIAYVPRNRKENGIIRDMSILENASLATLRKYIKHLLINRKEEAKDFERQVTELHIKMGKKGDLITSLSGGNQQKVVLAKWLTTDPKVLVLDNPTQGVDVEAKEEIYDIIRKLAAKDVAVIVLSSEAQEIIRVCDRALVMFHGSIMGEVSGIDMNEHKIMRMATGEQLKGVSV